MEESRSQIEEIDKEVRTVNRLIDIMVKARPTEIQAIRMWIILGIALFAESLSEEEGFRVLLRLRRTLDILARRALKRRAERAAQARRTSGAGLIWLRELFPDDDVEEVTGIWHHGDEEDQDDGAEADSAIEPPAEEADMFDYITDLLEASGLTRQQMRRIWIVLGIYLFSDTEPGPDMDVVPGLFRSYLAVRGIVLDVIRGGRTDVGQD